jgi:hypothetical protein
MLPMTEIDIATNGIRLHVTELGEGPAIPALRPRDGSSGWLEEGAGR